MIASRALRAVRVPFALLLLLAGLGLLPGAWLLSAATVRAARTVPVEIAEFAYVPATITVEVGDTVVWSNHDAVDHTVTTEPGAPAAFDEPVPAGGTASVTFSVPGTYPYTCTPHPTMTGSVIVRPLAITPDAAMGTAGLRLALVALGAMLLVVSGLLLLGLRGSSTRR